MNPALLQHPYPTEYSSNNNSSNNSNKYLGHDRPFANSTSLPANDFSLLSRKPENGLPSAPLGQMLTLPTNSGLDYNAQLIQDHPYHSSSQLLISPPSSIDGTPNGGLPSTPSSFPSYQSAGRLLIGNASSTDQYSTGSASFQPGNWNHDATMTEYNTRMRAPTLPPTLTPPSIYAHSNGISGQYFTPSSRSFDHYGSNFSHGRTYHPADISHTFSGNKLRTTSYTNASMTPVYPHGYTYPSMTNQSPGRSEGPPFDNTKKILPLITTSSREVIPEISANIQKGFFQVDDKWTCYRRNYFSVICGFHFKNTSTEGPVYLQRHSQLELVRQYAVSISAKTASGSNQDSETRTLVQHTPKRDKATESVPNRHPIQPSPMQTLHPSGSTHINPMYPGAHNMSPGMLGGFDAFTPHGQHSIPMSHTFERIQFQRATANNGKRRAQQQYFHVVVELSVQVGQSNSDNDWVVVATRQSSPMVVRGRSPGHYKDNRREGPTTMDPDSGSGTGGDGASGPYSMPPLMGQHPSSMEWSSNQRGHNNHYGHSYAGQDHVSTPSSSSVESMGLPGGRPRNGSYYVSKLAMRQSTNDYESEQAILNPITSRNRDDIVGRKRAFEDSGSDSDQHYYSTPSVDDNFSPPAYELTNISTTRPLCASS